jgi:8-oxo-dGTP pyrophosphatase MutT (NUDIX family)
MTGDKNNFQLSHFVSGRSTLYVGNAAAAIILIEDGRYLLQLRDDLESIWYPGHWGCFGGGVEEGENPVGALRRELREELALEFDEARFFTELQFDLSGLGLARYFRSYFLVEITLEQMTRLRLEEGAAVAAFHSDVILGALKVSPYDAFALFLHARGSRIKACTNAT